MKTKLACIEFRDKGIVHAGLCKRQLEAETEKDDRVDKNEVYAVTCF